MNEHAARSAQESSERIQKYPSFDEFNGMVWLNNLREIRELSRNHNAHADTAFLPTQTDSVAAVQKSIHAGYTLARIAHVRHTDEGVFGEVWHMSRAGWICQKNPLPTAQTQEQFFSYYQQDNLKEASIEQMLTPEQQAELEVTGFVATDMPVTDEMKNDFVVDIIKSQQESYQTLGVSRPRLADDLYIDEESTIEAVGAEAAEVLEAFSTDWIVLVTEPISLMRRIGADSYVVGVNLTSLSSESGPQMQMRYIYKNGDDLMAITDEPRGIRELFDKDSFDKRFDAWVAQEEFVPVRPHEAEYVSEYAQACTHVASLFEDASTTIDTHLPRELPYAIEGTRHSFVSLASVAAKQIGTDQPTYFQSVRMHMGATTYSQHMYMGMYRTDTGVVDDLQWYYNRQTGVVNVMCGSVADCDPKELAAQYRRGAARIAGVSKQTMIGVYESPYGDDIDFYTEDNAARTSWTFHPALEYDAAFAFINEWREATPVHPSKRRNGKK